MMEQEEIWKVIEGFPDYKISNKSHIWTNKSKQILKVNNGDIKLYDENNLPFTKSVEKLKREHFQEITEGEIWKDIEDFPDYQISNLGNVWSKINSKYLKLSKGCVKLNNDVEKLKSKSVKKLIKKHFEGDFKEDEVFEKIPGWDRYSISKNGRVRDDQEGIFIEPYLSTKEYLSVTLMGNKEKGNFKHLHNLLGLTFIPNPHNLPEVHHKDINKLNNDLSNLEWVSKLENTQSKNKNRPIGSVFQKKDTWKAEVTAYGKKYQFECAKKEVAEEWLDKRRFEITNNLDVESTGFIFPSRKSFKARIRINDIVKSFIHKEYSACEVWMKNIIDPNNPE